MLVWAKPILPHSLENFGWFLVMSFCGRCLLLRGPYCGSWYVLSPKQTVKNLPHIQIQRVTSLFRTFSGGSQEHTVVKHQSNMHYVVTCIPYTIYVQVTVDGQKSDVSSVSSGVPQGTVLAPPTISLCFINDLPNRITSNIKLYAA